ncbi:MAG: SDR family oxidoreductase [Hyphomicrobiales bacterium]
MPNKDFAGKTVVVTGAARGLGAAFAVVLADQGADVIMAARSNEPLATLAEAIRLRSGSRPETLVFDLADPSQTTLAAKKLRDEKPRIDILINNAAQWLPGRMDEHDAYAIVGTISSTVTGTLLFTRGLLKPLEASGAGDILNIISISGLVNTALSGASVAFHAAKHGQAGMTDGLRQELRGRPIRVSALYPPIIDDVSPLDEEAWDAKRSPDAVVTNRDVVETALFALSRPRHLTLASIVIDSEQGGLLPR